MAKKKRKKYPKLPNGYGSITYLGSNRRNPYGVYPPATEEYPNGQMKRGKAICYVSNWNIGFAILTAYKAGTYYDGMEKDLAEQLLGTESDTNEFIERILADHNIVARANKKTENDCPTFAEVYKKFFDWKFNGKKKLSDGSKRTTVAAFKNCSSLHDRKMNEIAYTELQSVLDDCPLKRGSIQMIKLLIKQMFKFSMAEGIIENNPTELLKINIEDDDEHGIPFSEDDLKVLWSNKDNDIVEALLIMCYSGHRIGELYIVDVNIDKKCFVGGLKTKSSKERIVPMHSSIYPIVKHRMKSYGKLMPLGEQVFRKKMYSTLEELGIARHTPHDCRHTFSMLCEKFDVSENDRKRMLGHKFMDVTNDVYGHRTLEDLKISIEKIKV